MKFTYIVSSEYSPLNKAGAIRMKALEESLSRMGHRVKVITSNNSRRNNKKNNIKTSIFSTPSNKNSFTIRLFKELILGFSISTILLFARKKKLVIITSPSFIMASFAAFVCKMQSVKYVFDVRDDYPRVYSNAGLISENSYVFVCLKRIEKLNYKNAFIISTATHGLKRNIDKEYNGIKTIVYRNGFLADKRPIITPTNKLKKFTLIFHGSLSTQQNIELLILLAKKLILFHDLNIIVVGKGSKEFLIKENSLPNIEYKGELNHNMIQELLIKCHIGISFRIDGKISEDSFPVKVYEFIGAKLPCIITPISEAGKFVEQHSIGFQFQNDEIDKIIETILNLKKNESQYSEIVKNIEKIKPNFSREFTTNNFVQTLNHLL